MTEQIKTTATGRGLQASGLTSAVMLSAILVGIGLDGRAQGNLVNLYDWSNNTRYSGSPNNNVRINSSDSAGFFGSGSTNNAPYPLALPGLAGQIGTTPGTMYEISFTMENNTYESIGDPCVCFGDFTTNLDLPVAQANGPQSQYYPVDVDLSILATSSTTDFTFTVPADEGELISLDNLTVTEVPEMSTTAIFGFFGCSWLFLRRWRQVQKAKHSLVRVKVN